MRRVVKKTEEGKARYEVKDQLLLVCDARCGVVNEERRDKIEKVT